MDEDEHTSFLWAAETMKPKTGIQLYETSCITFQQNIGWLVKNRCESFKKLLEQI